jgi:hypothetical protein
MKKIFTVGVIFLLALACQDRKKLLSVALPGNSPEGWFALILCDQMIDINHEHIGFIDTNQLAPHYEIKLLHKGLPYPNPISYSTIDAQFSSGGKTYRHILFYLGERVNESPKEESYSDEDWFESKGMRFLSGANKKGLLECPSPR